MPRKKIEEKKTEIKQLFEQCPAKIHFEGQEGSLIVSGANVQELWQILELACQCPSIKKALGFEKGQETKINKAVG